MLALTVSAALAWPAHAQNAPTSTPHSPAPDKLPRQVLQALQQAQVPPSALSVQITPLPHNTLSGQASRQLSYQAQTPVNPASVMKLFTTYAGLSLLGP
jgi:serine-type D-Ala-D-Ala carboxypeptidase/endopeptidase (penicillin-binding protein 4)